MDATQRQRLGAMVRQGRKRKGWTNQDLAEAAGLAPNTVSAIESGKNTRPGTLAAVMNALDIPPLSEQTTYPQHVDLIRDLVGQWLLNLPEREREQAERGLITFITSWRVQAEALSGQEAQQAARWALAQMNRVHEVAEGGVNHHETYENGNFPPPVGLTP